MSLAERTMSVPVAELPTQFVLRTEILGLLAVDETHEDAAIQAKQALLEVAIPRIQDRKIGREEIITVAALINQVAVPTIGRVTAFERLRVYRSMNPGSSFIDGGTMRYSASGNEAGDRYGYTVGFAGKLATKPSVYAAEPISTSTQDLKSAVGLTFQFADAQLPVQVKNWNHERSIVGDTQTSMYVRSWARDRAMQLRRVDQTTDVLEQLIKHRGLLDRTAKDYLNLASLQMNSPEMTNFIWRVRELAMLSLRQIDATRNEDRTEVTDVFMQEVVPNLRFADEQLFAKLVQSLVSCGYDGNYDRIVEAVAKSQAYDWDKSIETRKTLERIKADDYVQQVLRGRIPQAK